MRILSNMDLLDYDERFAELDRLGVAHEDFHDLAGPRGRHGFMVFMASMIIRVWPEATVSPTFTKGGASGWGCR